jgi:outer membrane protein OmpA-like peptidoglycan-associated protein
MKWMESTLRLIGAEARELRTGGETVITRLADILVIQAIRSWIARDPASRTLPCLRFSIASGGGRRSKRAHPVDWRHHDRLGGWVCWSCIRDVARRAVESPLVSKGGGLPMTRGRTKVAARAAWVVMLAGTAAGMAAGAEATQATGDHALIKPYPGSVLSRRDNDGFSSYKAVVSLDPKGKTDDEVIKTVTVSGELTRLSYQNPQGRSPLEILANYREGLEKAGFEVLFRCAAAECGPGWASSRWGRVTGLRYVSSDMHFLSARRDSDTGVDYVAISVIRPRHSIDVLQGKPMQTGLVTVSEAALKTGLEADGRVVLEGVFFDHDKATITAESKAALDVIGKFLTGNPRLNVFIVGHTDGVGAFDHNLALSRQRAQAVVDRLVQEYKIAAARLSAHGVGPLSPARSNATDRGKAANRRVEMVAR